MENRRSYNQKIPKLFSRRPAGPCTTCSLGLPGKTERLRPELIQGQDVGPRLSPSDINDHTRSVCPLSTKKLMRPEIHPFTKSDGRSVGAVLSTRSNTSSAPCSMMANAYNRLAAVAQAMRLRVDGRGISSCHPETVGDRQRDPAQLSSRKQPKWHGMSWTTKVCRRG